MRPLKIWPKAITSNNIKPTIPSGYTCNKSHLLPRYWFVAIKDEAKTPGEKAYVFPGTIRWFTHYDRRHESGLG